MTKYVTYAHKDDPKGTRFRGIKGEKLPKWSVDVKDDAEPSANSPKASREKLGLTQTQMGTLHGYSGENVRQMVYDIETGRRDLMPCQRRLLEAYLSGYRPKDWPK
jgi:hypothetical protein